MSAHPREQPAVFDPAAFETFRFVSREIDRGGRVRLGYALDEEVAFVEEFDLPVAAPVGAGEAERVDGLLSLLHWVAGVSYFKTAAPGSVRCEAGSPSPAGAALLEAVYSEGLGEFAFVNGLSSIPRPRFPGGGVARPGVGQGRLDRVLVPIGGGKDSVVALEAVRRSGCELALFSVGDAGAIARTASVSGLRRLVAHRRLDPGLGELNRAGARNGHVPVTAIVACAGLLTAALNGFDGVALANERSASSGNVVFDGVEVNHQWSKSLMAERLLRGAVAEAGGGVEVFSVLRPASELAIARAFARLPAYHGAFTSCNAIFRLDAAVRTESWCCDCPKCRFVFLILAPFMDPDQLRAVFGRDLLEDERQFEGFALLTATGGSKPFECVGEAEESLAAMRMLAADERWREHGVVRRLAAEVLPGYPATVGAPEGVLALSEEHLVPAGLLPGVRALLGA